MPIHDWTRADAGLFHHLHFCWVSHLATSFNRGGLPAGFYALIAPSSGRFIASRADQSGPPENYYFRRRSVVHVRADPGDEVVAVVHTVPPGTRLRADRLTAFGRRVGIDLRRNRACLVIDLFRTPVTWPADSLLTLARADPGGVLADVRWLFAPGAATVVPLDATYQKAWADVPRVCQAKLDPPADRP